MITLGSLSKNLDGIIWFNKATQRFEFEENPSLHSEDEKDIVKAKFKIGDTVKFNNGFSDRIYEVTDVYRSKCIDCVLYNLREKCHTTSVNCIPEYNLIAVQEIKENQMNREKFKEQMKFPPQMSKDTIENIQTLHLAHTDASEIYIVAMEEMAELQKEISKELRGQGDRDGILEELADVMIVCGNIGSLQGFTENELARAVEIKLERILKNMAEKEQKNESECKVDSDCPHRGVGCRSCGNSSSYGEVYHESGENAGWTPGK